jgi:hypothetical protein
MAFMPRKSPEESAKRFVAREAKLDRAEAEVARVASEVKQLRSDVDATIRWSPLDFRCLKSSLRSV